MRRRTFLATPLLALAAPAAPGALPEASPAPDYPPVTPGRRMVFPRDHGAHADFRTEWWYVTGALDAPQADIGFQLTFFRSRPRVAENLRSPLAARQILFAHAALTLPGKRLRHDERAARAGLGGAFSSLDCDVSIGGWRMQREQRASGEVFRLQVQSPQFSWDLTLTPVQSPMLQGDGGYSRKGEAAELASYYLSWPQLQVAGSLAYDGRREQAAGRAWFDHEWSSTLLGGSAVGWDWVGINLFDGGALMAFRMRDASNATLFAHAAWRDAAGRLRQFGTGEVSFTPLRTWLSPVSGGRYPVQLEIRFGEQILRTLPVLDDQELSTRRPLPVVYWEGLIRVEGSLPGRGYLEMTGYAGRVST